MTAYRTNLLNAVILAGISIWQFISEAQQKVPVIVLMVLGIALLSLNNGVKYGIPSQVRAAVIISAVSVLYCLYLVRGLLGDSTQSVEMAYIVPGITSLLALISMTIGRKARRPPSKNE